jgi:hypothetical protein
VFEDNNPRRLAAMLVALEKRLSEQGIEGG